MPVSQSIFIFWLLEFTHFGRMSKLLVDLFMLNTKAVVNAWTWTTLPFYAIAQQPWKRLKLSKSFGVRMIKDKHGRTVYSRPCSIKVEHPLMQYTTLNEIIPNLDPKQIGRAHV